MRVLEPEDRACFQILTGAMPKQIGGPVSEFLALLTHPEFARPGK
jgi:hypothetical protein